MVIFAERARIRDLRLDFEFQSCLIYIKYVWIQIICLLSIEIEMFDLLKWSNAPCFFCSILSEESSKVDGPNFTINLSI